MRLQDSNLLTVPSSKTDSNWRDPVFQIRCKMHRHFRTSFSLSQFQETIHELYSHYHWLWQRDVATFGRKSLFKGETGSRGHWPRTTFFFFSGGCGMWNTFNNTQAQKQQKRASSPASTMKAAAAPAAMAAARKTTFTFQWKERPAAMSNGQGKPKGATCGTWRKRGRSLYCSSSRESQTIWRPRTLQLGVEWWKLRIIVMWVYNKSILQYGCSSQR